MTTPQSPDQGLTTAEALALVAAARAAQASSDDVVVSTAATAAEVLISTRERLADWLMSMFTPRWQALNPYSGNEVQEFAAYAAGQMATAQTVVARTASASQTQMLAAQDVKVKPRLSNPVDVRGVVKIDDTGRAVIERPNIEVAYQDGKGAVDLDTDATTEGLFSRPARVERYLRSKDIDPAQAHAEALTRMQTLVGDNLILAQRLAEHEVLAQAAAVDDRVIGLRRIIHPELSRTGTCGLCIAASDQIYRVRELRPIHTKCQCTVAAVTREFDPADVLNKADLAAVYEAAGGTDSPLLKRVRFQVDEHGELGPVLVPEKPYKPRKQYTRPRRQRARSRTGNSRFLI